MGYVVVREIIGKDAKHSVGDILSDPSAWPQLPNMVRSSIVVSVPDGKEQEFVQALGRGVSPQGLARSYGPSHEPRAASVIAAQLMRDIASGKIKKPQKKVEPRVEAKTEPMAEPMAEEVAPAITEEEPKKKKRKKLISSGDE